MKIQNWLTAAALAGALGLTTSTAFAQANEGGQRQQRQFDPARMQERMAERTKEMLEITDEEEWKAVQPLVQKVQEARMQAFMGGGRGMMGFGGPGGGPRRGPEGQPPGQGGDQPQRRFGPASSPEAEALQKAIDAKAPKAELKAAVTKYAEARKAKQAELEKAQENLRKVLTARQEAIATLNGLL